MKLTQATYAATINLGYYESKKIELQYELDEKDSLDKVRKVAHVHFKKEAKLSEAEGSHYLK